MSNLFAFLEQGAFFVAQQPLEVAPQKNSHSEQGMAHELGPNSSAASKQLNMQGPGLQRRPLQTISS